jgi:ubiquinone/menaquinone biosynthesis C-methylase UbiE
MTDFDARAKNWDADPLKVERARLVAAAIRTAVPLTKRMRALEYGCGTGLLSFALRDAFEHITLADTSPCMLAVLSEKIKAAGVENMFPILLGADAGQLPASSFDVIYSLMTLHHIANTAGVLRMFHNLLVPGGWLSIADLDCEDGSFHDEAETGVHHGFDRAALEREAQAAGFMTVRFQTVFSIPKNGRDYPIFLMIASKQG